MKYVIFQRKSLKMPVIFHEHINHCDVSIGPEWKPVSAGYVNVIKGDLVVDLNSESTSLKLKPSKDDDSILRMFQHNYPISCFFNFDDNDYNFCKP